jgi:phenylpropionate dioxygenase-like ring-hydroxylating dioxygenase large terminal subunit
MPISGADLWPTLRHYWHVVGVADSVRDKPVATKLLNEQLVLFRLGGKVVCFQDLCIHRGTPLSLGRTEGDLVVCAYHGWAYAADGSCVRIPSLPPNLGIPRKARATTYRCEERYGFVWVCLDEPRAPIPEFPEYNDPSYERFLLGPLLWRCGAAREVENFVDQAHFAWVHEGLLGDRAHTEVPSVPIERCGEELRFSFDVSPNEALPVPHQRVYRLFRPFTVYQHKTRADGRREIFFHCCTPNAEKESTGVTWMLRNFELNPEEEEKRRQLARTVAEQDRVIVEGQRPWELPLDLSAELHLKGPDAVAIAYRRMLAELGVE